MKQYIKNIMILILALPWGLLLTNCSDSESDYSDDNAYPPPTVELTSPSEIDVVEYNSTVTVSARSFSAVGIHSIYATLLKMDENGEYEEINATERQRLKIDTLQTDMTLEFDLNVKVNTREAAGILVTSTDVLTKTAQKVIPIKKITKLPSQIFTEPSDFPVLVPDEEVSLSVVIRSAVGIKSIKHTLCNKVLGDLKEYTTIPVSGNPLEMEFILKTVVDNKETNGIKIVVEDIEGLKEEKIINIEGLEGVDNNVALVFNDIEMAPEWEHSTEPDQPYIFSIEGIMIQGVQKHVLSLKEIKGYGSKANGVDFAFINIWRNPSFVAVKNRGFSFVSASRITTAVKKLRRRAALAYRKIRRQASPRSLCMWATRKFRWGCFMTPRRRFSTARTMPAFWGSALISMLHRKFSTRRSIPGSAISASASCMMQPRRLPACSTTPSALSLIMRAKIG